MKQKSVYGEDIPLDSSANDFSGDVSEDFQPPTPPTLIIAAPLRVAPLVPQPLPPSKLAPKQKEEASGGMVEVHDNNQPRSGYREPHHEMSYQNATDIENQIVRQRRRDHNHSHELTHEDSVDPGPYNEIAKYMPEFEFRGLSLGRKVILGFAVVLSAIASLYNAQFAGTFGSYISDSFFLVWYVSIAAFFANMAIGSRSFVLGADNIQTSIFDRRKPNRLPLPDDQQIKNSLKLKAAIAVIGAAPPVLFAIQKPLFGIPELANWGVYLPLMATQLAVVSMQNLRGVTKDDDMHKQAAVFHIREDLLKRIASCIDGDIPEQLMQDIKLMAKGMLSVSTKSKGTEFVGKALGWAYFSFIGIHAAATGYSVIRSFKKLLFEWIPLTPIVNNTISILNTTLPPLSIETGSIWYDGAIVVFGTVALTSFFLRWMLLGRSAKGFVDSVFAMSNRSLFKLHEIEIIDSVFSNEKQRKIMQVVSAAVSLTVGISSLGSASEISHRNFFNDSPNAGPMIASFAIGGGGAGPINTLDFKSLLDKLCGYFYIWQRSKRRGYEATDRFGESRNEFLLKFMRIITAMSVAEFANNFLVTFNSSIESLEQEFQRMGITVQQRDACIYMQQEGLNGVGYARNSILKNLYQDLDTLRAGSPRLFDSWKRGALQSEEEKRRHDMQQKREVKKVQMTAASSPSLPGDESADDLTPLVSVSIKHSIN